MSLFCLYSTVVTLPPSPLPFPFSSLRQTCYLPEGCVVCATVAGTEVAGCCTGDPAASTCSAAGGGAGTGAGAPPTPKNGEEMPTFGGVTAAAAADSAWDSAWDGAWDTGGGNRDHAACADAAATYGALKIPAYDLLVLGKSYLCWCDKYHVLK